MIKLIFIILFEFLYLTQLFAETVPSWKIRKERNMLKVAINSVPKTFDSSKLIFAEHFLMLQCVCQTLVRVNESGRIVSDAAEKWQISEDGKKIRFFLKDNLKFSDNTNITSEDVIKSFNKHLTPDSSTAVGGYLKRIISEHEKFKIINDKTFEISLNFPYPPLFHLLAMPGFCIQKKTNSSLEFIGSGPLKIEFSDNTRVHLIKNTNYTGEIKLKEIEFIPLQTSSAMVEQLLSGDVDLTLGLSTSDIKLVPTNEYTIIASESLATAHFYFNTEKSEVFTQPNRDLLKIIFQEVAKKSKTSFLEPIKTIFPAGIMSNGYYNIKSESIAAINLNKSTTILKNKIISIKLLASVYDENFKDTLFESLKSNGIQANISRLSHPDFVTALLNGEYDILGGRYFLNYPDPDAALDPWDTKSKVRLGRFDSKELFKNIDKIRGIPNNVERLNNYAKVITEFEKMNYIIPMYQLKLPIVHRKDLNIPKTSFRYETELWKIFWN